MVDWMSPQVIAADGFIFLKLIHVTLGIYLWEWFISLRFDWSYISGKKKFRWPLAFYFLNRYALLFSLIGIIIALNVTSEINCQALYTFNQLTGNMAVGLVSINLSIRTMAVWSQRWYIVSPLIVIILGHWSILMHGVLLKAKWEPATGCVITETNPTIISASFIYSMCFDFVVLCLTGIGLQRSSALAGRSRIGTLIFADGLVYFFIAFLANLIAVTFILLNLNPVMSIIATVPAATASTIVTCRAIRRLANYTSKGAEVYQAASTVSTVTANRFKLNTGHPSVSVGSTSIGGVHVQMQTFQHPEPSDDKVEHPSELKSHLEL